MGAVGAWGGGLVTFIMISLMWLVLAHDRALFARARKEQIRCSANTHNYIRVVLKRNSQRFFSADFCCLCAVFFETGSLEGFVVLELPRYFLQRARKLGCFGGCGDGDPMAAAMAAANATAAAAMTAVAAAMATVSDNCVEGICVVNAATGR